MTNISQIAKNYAKSLLKSNDNFDSLRDEFSAVLETVKTQDLFEILNNPSISLNIKSEIIDEIFQNKVSNGLVNFLKLLAEKNRFSVIGEIFEAFNQEIDNVCNIKRVTVISAINLDENKKQKIIEKLEQKLNKKVITDFQINSEILGGLIFKLDDNIIDNSLKEKIRKLSKI